MKPTSGPPLAPPPVPGSADGSLSAALAYIGRFFTACPAADVNAAGGGSYADCDRHHAAYGAVLQRWHPATVFLTNAEHSDLEVVDKSENRLPRTASIAAYKDALGRTLQLITHHGAHAVVLSPPPAGYALSMCDVPGSGPQKCLLGPLGTWFALNTVDRQVAGRAGATYADLLALFCHDLLCPGVVGDLVVRSDNIHLTPEYATLIAPSFAHFLTGAGITR